MSNKLCYRINPFLRFHWSSHPYDSDDLSSVVYTAADAEDGQKVTRVELFHVLHAVAGGLPYDELKDVIRSELSVNGKIAANVLDMLLERDFIIPAESEFFDRTREWYEKEWHHALFYHTATRNVDHVEEADDQGDTVRATITKFQNESDPPPLTAEVSGPKLTLPDPGQLPDTPLIDVLKSRGTSRSFSGSISSATISTLLHYTSKNAQDHREHIRSSSSDPLQRVVSSYVAHEIYPVILNGDDLQNGIYHYEAEEHRLTILEKGNFEDEIIDIAIGQQWVGEAAVVFLFVTNFERYQWQYRHSDELRNLFVDVSALAHRLILTATALDKRNFLTPAMRDDHVEEFLDLTPPEEGATYLVAVGEE